MRIDLNEAIDLCGWKASREDIKTLGACRPDEKKILLHKGLSLMDEIQVLAHEVGHMIDFEWEGSDYWTTRLKSNSLLILEGRSFLRDSFPENYRCVEKYAPEVQNQELWAEMFTIWSFGHRIPEEWENTFIMAIEDIGLGELLE